MRCSNCSAPAPPVVAIDIDGTLGDYHTHFIRFALGWLGLDQLPAGVKLYSGEEPFKEWFQASFKTDVTTFRNIKLAYRQGGMKRTMPVYRGADRMVIELQGAGAEIWLTTTRPHDRYDRVDPDTREWLRRNQIAFDGLLFSGNKIDELLARIDPERIVTVLDDQEEVLKTVAERIGGNVAVLRRTGYNSAVYWPRGGDALNGLTSAIKVDIARWIRRHGE